MPQPPKKKAAPVDTTRLKKDIQSDAAEVPRRTQRAATSGPQEARYQRDEAQAAGARASARFDSLSSARAGTLPAAAPVDTTRLKQDIAKPNRPGFGLQLGKVLSGIERRGAQKDTLAQARKGEVTATSGKIGRAIAGRKR